MASQSHLSSECLLFVVLCCFGSRFVFGFLSADVDVDVDVRCLQSRCVIEQLHPTLFGARTPFVTRMRAWLRVWLCDPSKMAKASRQTILLGTRFTNRWPTWPRGMSSATLFCSPPSPPPALRLAKHKIAFRGPPSATAAAHPPPPPIAVAAKVR